ncbi:MAG TPA: hypothetical protein VK483_11625 [Chitinophagaceae bacterium]|nr:hypothetical protein [Chitinophagaceae bacterium]
MRVIKLGIISVIVFSILITGISLFFPSHVRISKAINIYAKKDSVLAEVKDARRWKKWYPGFELTADSSFSADGVMIDYTDPLKATYIIINRPKSDGDSVIAATVNKGQLGNDITWNCISYPDSNMNERTELVTLQWYMDFHLRWYPWEKFSSLLLEKRYGAMMEQGLTRLKARLEK